jgi:hypothetical protein
MVPGLEREELLTPGKLKGVAVEKNGRAGEPQSPVEYEKLGVEKQTLTHPSQRVGHIKTLPSLPQYSSPGVG